MGSVTRIDVIQVLMPLTAAGPEAREPRGVSRHSPSSPREAAATSRCFARILEGRSGQGELQVLREPKLGIKSLKSYGGGDGGHSVRCWGELG